MANLGEMAVALQVSRHRLENDVIRLRRICFGINLSDMGSAIALEGFERDIMLVDEAIVILRELSRYEDDVLDMISRKNRPSEGWLRRIMETVSAALI